MDGSWGKTLNETTPQTAAQTLNKELKDPSSVQSYHVPCERTLMELTAGCLLSSWTAWPLLKLVDRLTMKLVDQLNAISCELLDCYICEPLDR